MVEGNFWWFRTKQGDHKVTGCLTFDRAGLGRDVVCWGDGAAGFELGERHLAEDLDAFRVENGCCVSETRRVQAAYSYLFLMVMVSRAVLEVFELKASMTTRSVPLLLPGCLTCEAHEQGIVLAGVGAERKRRLW